MKKLKNKSAKQITVQRDRGSKTKLLAFGIVPLMSTSESLSVNTQFKYGKSMHNVATNGSFSCLSCFQSIALRTFSQLH